MGYHLSDAQVEKIPVFLIEADGNMAAVGRRLGVSRKAIFERVRKDPDLRALVDELNETLLDDLETNIRKMARGDDKTSLTACIFLLKTLGKSRGYVERVEQETVSFEEIERAIAAMTADEKAEARKRIRAGESAVTVCREIAARE